MPTRPPCRGERQTGLPPRLCIRGSQILRLTARAIDDALAAAPPLSASEVASFQNQFATIDDLKRLTSEIGVSRLGDATNLDRINAHNFYAIRPAARHPDAIYSSGKGFTRFDAQTKAVFGSHERWAAEAPAHCFDATSPEVAAAAARVDAVIYLAHKLATDVPVRGWWDGDCLTRSVAVAPEPMIAFPASDPAYPPATTTGLAGHVSQALAIETAILERRSVMLPPRWPHSVSNGLIAMQSSASAWHLLDTMAAENIECLIFRIDHGAPFALQVSYAFAFDHVLGVPQSHCSGLGAALTLADAIDKALLEVTQSRSAFITGMRDDGPARSVKNPSTWRGWLASGLGWSGCARCGRSRRRTTHPTRCWR